MLGVLIPSLIQVVPAMWVTALLVVYCTLVAIASLAGGWLPAMFRMTHRRTQLVLSLVSGLMLGVAFFHMLPHAAAHLPSIEWATGGAVCGLLVLFFLIRIFHFHQHGAAEEPASDKEKKHSPEEHCLGETYHSTDCPQDPHTHADHNGNGHTHQHHRMSWVGLLTGLIVHTMIDGMALAASVLGEASHHGGYAAFGLGAFLAIALHKPLDAVSIAAVMRSSGWSQQATGADNFCFCLMCPAGALIFAVAMQFLPGEPAMSGQMFPVGCALAFSAGVFICISLGDLLPEVQFHSHDRIKLSAALLLGIALAYGIHLLPGHSHSHEAPTTPAVPTAVTP